RFARVRSDFCAPLLTPVLNPPTSMVCPGRAGDACGRSDRRRYFVLRPAILGIRHYTAVCSPSISPTRATADLLLRYRQRKHLQLATMGGDIVFEVFLGDEFLLT